MPYYRRDSESQYGEKERGGREAMCALAVSPRRPALDSSRNSLMGLPDGVQQPISRRSRSNVRGGGGGQGRVGGRVGGKVGLLFKNMGAVGRGSDGG